MTDHETSYYAALHDMIAEGLVKTYYDPERGDTVIALTDEGKKQADELAKKGTIQ